MICSAFSKEAVILPTVVSNNSLILSPTTLSTPISVKLTETSELVFTISIGSVPRFCVVAVNGVILYRVLFFSAYKRECVPKR